MAVFFTTKNLEEHSHNKNEGPTPCTFLLYQEGKAEMTCVAYFAVDQEYLFTTKTTMAEVQPSCSSCFKP